MPTCEVVLVTEPAWKEATGQVARERRGAMPAVPVRMAGVYDDVGHAPPLADQIRRIWERRATSDLSPAPPSTVTPFLHIADLIDAMVAVADHRRELPDEVAILLGEEDAPGFTELQHLIAAAIASPLESDPVAWYRANGLEPPRGGER